MYNGSCYPNGSYFRNTTIIIPAESTYPIILIIFSVCYLILQCLEESGLDLMEDQLTVLAILTVIHSVVLPLIYLLILLYIYNTMYYKIQCHTNVHALQYLNYINALLYHEHYGCNALQCYCLRRLAPTMFHILLVIVPRGTWKYNYVYCHTHSRSRLLLSASNSRSGSRF